jgi:hypothetical protein
MPFFHSAIEIKFVGREKNQVQLGSKQPVEKSKFTKPKKSSSSQIVHP